MTGAIAKRYARALAGVAKEQNRLEETAEELSRVGEWLGDPDVEAALRSPNLSLTARRGLVGRLAESLDVSDIARNFLALLAERNRLGLFHAIVEAYQRLVDQSLGRVRAVVHAAAPLNETSIEEIRSVLEQITAKKVIVSVEIDPTLLAGVSVEVEGRVYDGSARTQLEHLARAMSRDVRAA